MKDARGTSKSSQPAPADGIIRFGSFEVDLHAGELRKSGLRVKLGGQPFDVLVTLLERPGQVVTRDQLHEKLWSQDTFVDFEHGLNKAINKVREALCDDADNPRFIETLPRRGYRFLALVMEPSQLEAEAADQVAPIADQPVTSPPTLPERVPAKRWPIWLAASFTAVIIVVVVVVGSRSPQPPRVLRYTQLTHDGLNKNGVPVTDGSRVYFGEQDSQGRGVIAQVSVGGGTVSALATSPGLPVSPTDYSPARSELLLTFAVGESPLWALSVPGASAPRRVGSLVVNDAGWAPDGQSILYGSSNEIDIVKADGSEPRKLATVRGAPAFPRMSPDGKIVRFSMLAADLAPSSTSLWEMSADGSNLHPLFPDWKTRNDFVGSWTADGRYYIYASTLPNGRGSIFAIRQTKGLFERHAPQPVEMTSGPLSFSAPIPSKDGKQIFAAGFLNRGELMRYDGKIHGWVPYLSGLSAADLDFSRDGEWITYVLVPEGTLWRSRVDGSERLQLTISPMRTAMPRWSPDGKRIAFIGLKPGGVWTIYSVPADGGEAEQLVSDNKYHGDPNWSPDGTHLVFGDTSVQPKAIHIIDLQSHRLSEVPGSEGLFSPRWSPDGRFLLALTAPVPLTPHTSSQPRPTKLMRFDLSGQKWQEIFEANFIAYPTFSRNAKYVYFSDSTNGFYRVQLPAGKIEHVANIDVPGGMKQDEFWYWTGLAPDDSPLFLRDASTQEIYALDVDFP
jgi:Tol biopolymer transport system component/DNA-binding winged helix-turn-helix (wHTH) protein